MAMQALASVGLALLGLMVLVAERLLPRPEPGHRPDAIRQALQWAGRVLVVVALAVLSGPLLPVILGAWLGCLLVASWRAGWICITSTLAAAAERGVPFDLALEALAAEERGAIRRRARRLVELLRMGWPLPNALEQVRNPLSRERLAAIRVGHEVGDLATPLRQAYAWLAGKGYFWGDLGTRVWYFLNPLFLLLAVLSFFQLKIAPAFVKILEDYGCPLPPITQLVLTWYRLETIWFFGAYLLLLAMGFVVLYGVLRYSGLVRGAPPGVDWLVRPFRAADVLDTLALAVRRNRPLVAPLAMLSKEYPGWAFRRRLREVYSEVQAGADWCQSLQRRGLIGEAERMVLEAAGRAGNLPWALEEMAASLRRRHAYRLRALALAVFPLGVLALAAAVGLMVVGYFYPLVIMIESLATL